MGCGKPCGCASYRDHLLSVGVAATAMPSRFPQAADVERTQRALAADAPAYKRLRRNGVQPKGIDGCARIEALASHPAEVETGTLHRDVPTGG